MILLFVISVVCKKDSLGCESERREGEKRVATRARVEESEREAERKRAKRRRSSDERASFFCPQIFFLVALDRAFPRRSVHHLQRYSHKRVQLDIFLL